MKWRRTVGHVSVDVAPLIARETLEMTIDTYGRKGVEESMLRTRKVRRITIEYEQGSPQILEPIEDEETS